MGEGTFVGEETGGGVPVSFVTSSPSDKQETGVNTGAGRRRGISQLDTERVLDKVL